MRKPLQIMVEGNFGLTSGVAWWMNEANVLFWCAEELDRDSYRAVRVDVGAEGRMVDCSVYISEVLSRTLTRVRSGYVHSGTYTVVNPVDKQRLMACLQRSNPDMDRVGSSAAPPHLTGGETAASDKRGSQEWPHTMSAAERRTRPRTRSGVRRRLFETAEHLQQRVRESQELEPPEKGPGAPATDGVDRTSETMRQRRTKTVPSGLPRVTPRATMMRRRRDAVETRPVGKWLPAEDTAGAGPGGEPPPGSGPPPEDAVAGRTSPPTAPPPDRAPPADESRSADPRARARASSGQEPPVTERDGQTTLTGRPRFHTTRRVRVTPKTDQMNPWIATPEGSAPPLVSGRIQPGDPPMVLVPCDDEHSLHDAIKLRKSRIWISITPIVELEPGTRLEVFLRLPDATFIQFEGRVSDQDLIRTVLAADFLDQAQLVPLLAAMGAD